MTVDMSQKAKKVLVLQGISHEYQGEDAILAFYLTNGTDKWTIWFRYDIEYDPYVCDDRCDGLLAAIFLPAMKSGYHVFRSAYPISKKLYQNLTRQIIPQFYDVGRDRGECTLLEIEAPLTDEQFDGQYVGSGMSCGVDAFATLYEYGGEFQPEDRRVSLLTHFQSGAHHGKDFWPWTPRGSESPQELYQNQAERAREFCVSNGYRLLTCASNLGDVLEDAFHEWAHGRTHTVRNLGMALLFQKAFHIYYYSSSYSSMKEWRFGISSDQSGYERWLIPLLGTESLSFFLTNQDWTRLEKTEKLLHFEACHDYLQVCLTKTGNCGICAKCRRTLLQLDALGGDEALEKFGKAFDIDTYRREHRMEWIRAIMEEKDCTLEDAAQTNVNAHYYDETFVCMAKRHPELFDNFLHRRDGVKWVTLLPDKVPEDTLRKHNMRFGVPVYSLPSELSDFLFWADKTLCYEYVGESAFWIGIRLHTDCVGYVRKEMAELSELACLGDD